MTRIMVEGVFKLSIDADPAWATEKPGCASFTELTGALPEDRY